MGDSDKKMPFAIASLGNFFLIFLALWLVVRSRREAAQACSPIGDAAGDTLVATPLLTPVLQRQVTWSTCVNVDPFETSSPAFRNVDCCVMPNYYSVPETVVIL